MDPAVQTIVNKAQVLLRTGQRAEARKGLTQAVRWKPDEAILWYWMARALDEEAHKVDALERALRLDPGLREAQSYLQEIQNPPPPPPAAPEPEPQAAAEPTIDLSWLLADDDAAAPTPRTPTMPAPPDPSPVEEDVGENVTDVEEDIQEDIEGLGQWGLLAELEAGASEVVREEPRSPTPRPSLDPQDDPPQWGFLEELERTIPAAGSETFLPRAETVEEETRGEEITEEQLWWQAELFIGPPSADGGGADRRALPAPERGAFAFADATPSPVAHLPVRGGVTALTAEEIFKELGAVPAATGAEAASEGQASAAPKKRGPAQRLLGCVTQLLLWTVVLLGISAFLWFGSCNIARVVSPESLEAYPEIGVITTRVCELPGQVLER